jgi:sodium/hydrogen exchanger-like protein 6/7
MYSAAYSPKDAASRRDRSSTATLLNGGTGPSTGSGDSDDEFGLPPTGKNRAVPVAHPDEFDLDLEGISDDDLPPAAGGHRLRRSASHPSPGTHTTHTPSPNAASASVSPARREASGLSAREALRDLFSGGASGDHAAWFRQIDEDYIKPKLLLDQSNHKGPGPGAV